MNLTKINSYLYILIKRIIIIYLFLILKIKIKSIDLNI
jgi:hypothetical protein